MRQVSAKGQRIGPFRLVRLLSEGGMGAVYLAERADDEYTQQVAIKLMRTGLGQDPAMLRRFRTERQILADLNHPYIARLLDGGSTPEGWPYLVMEFIDGSPIDQYCAAHQLSIDDRLQLFLKVCAAVEYAHLNHVIHRDLKPANILVSKNGTPKLLDFGIAKLWEPESAESGTPAHRTGRFMTPAYASPEMLENDVPDPRDDVYALACVAWKLITGKLPFKAKDPSAARNVAQLACPRELSRREFRALCHALQFEREKRTPSARQFLLEFSGAGSKVSWPVAAGIVVSMTALIAAAAFFALHPVPQKTPASSVAPAVATAPLPTAPLEPAPGQVFRDCPTCPLMKVLAAGDFQQGTPAGADALAFEMPQHKVTITHAFAAGVYDVTVGEYSEFVAATGVGANNCATYDGTWRVNPTVTWRNAIESQTSSHPVSCVSWHDAKDYAAWLSHNTHQVYRLPSASEWEYAARAGSAAQVPWTTPAEACAYANVADQTAAQHYHGWTVLPCADEFVQSAPVGSFKANAFGLYDMLGNVFQWTEDCWTDNYQGAPTDGSAQSAGDCTQHELRGGSWFTQPDFVRNSYRNRFDGNYRSSSIGFRLIREMPQ